MKNIEAVLYGILILVIIGFIVANTKLHQDVQELIKQNEELEEVASEIQKQYNWCGWYEDFYYEHAQEFGAFE